MLMSKAVYDLGYFDVGITERETGLDRNSISKA